MTGLGTPPCSWRALLLVAIGSTLGGILLGVWLQPPGVQPPRVATGVVGGLGDIPHVGTSPPDPSPPDRSPVRLEIPAIDVTTPLVRLGLTPDRTVEVPSNPDRAGWFAPGTPPGQRGSAVILGHIDSSLGPAVFARLQELRPGDTVMVDRADGSTLRFVVREAVLYANPDFPAHLVYAAQHGRHLNLVTCGGTYDSARGGYQSNLVVYAQRSSGPRPR